MRGTPMTAGLMLLAVVLAIVAVLYALGTIGWFANPSDVHHYKHAAFFVGLAVLAAVGANFARSRPPEG